VYDRIFLAYCKEKIMSIKITTSLKMLQQNFLTY